MGTILTFLVLTGIVAAVILIIRRGRKNHKCAGCSNGKYCNARIYSNSDKTPKQ